MLTAYAAETNQHVFLSPSEDTVSGNPLTVHQKAAVAALDPKDRGDIPDTLEIVIGMPCMVTANIATTLGVANGSRGTVVGICVHPQDERLLQTAEVRLCAVACNTPIDVLTALCEFVAATGVCTFQTGST